MYKLKSDFMSELSSNIAPVKKLTIPRFTRRAKYAIIDVYG